MEKREGDALRTPEGARILRLAEWALHQARKAANKARYLRQYARRGK